MTRARSASPLRLLSPAGGGHAAWVFQSSLGGGFVGRDAVELDVVVGADAALFLSSQATSKVYRATRSRFALEAKVARGATLVAWPDPVTCFAGARFEQTQRFSLADTASLIVVDAWTAGRIARGERWAFDHLATRVTLEIAGEPVYDDGLLLSAAHGDLAARLGDTNAFATIVLAGPQFAAAASAIADDIEQRSIDSRPLCAASRWPWGLVIRLAATSTEALGRLTWELIGPHASAALGADPHARKW
ncbi:MAG: urease accessory protein UreD [Myxococcales bacterium]|nr:urease accessory protein UreD [Myxococcales bacterium]